MNRQTPHFLLVFSLGLSLWLTGCGPAPSSSNPDAYPSGSLTLICPWAPGGGTDRVARFWADQLQSALGKPCQVVNKTGGGGAIGHGEGARATPDGHTLTMATFELSTMHWMGISPLSHQDFLPLLQVNADAAAILVHADSPWNTLNDLLEDVRKNPGKRSMSGTAIGGAWDLARAGLMQAAQIPINSIVWVPTKGSAPSLVKLLGKHIDIVCCSLPEAASQLEAKQLKALAIMAETRLPQYSDVPTCKEQGIDWVAVGWRGLCLPKETPPQIVDRLMQECSKIAESNDYKDFMDKNGFNIEIRQGQAFADFLTEQDAQWKSVIEAAGYQQQP